MPCYYDAIPAGKKAKLNEKTGEYELVDLVADNVDDLRTMLDEAKATIKSLESEITSLNVQLHKHQDSKKK